MKKLLFFSLLIWQFNCLTAQTNVYHPFPLSNAEWKYRNADLCNSGISALVCNKDYQYRFNGDTIIGGKKYAKLYKDLSYVNCSCGNAPNYQIITVYAGGLRNDTVNKKVFYNLTGSEIILYDFNVVVGGKVLPSCSNTVVKIDSVYVGGKYRKKFIQGIDSLEFIEGIGSVGTRQGGSFADLISPFCGPGLSPYVNFVCFSNNAVSYVKDNFVCNLHLAVDESINLIDISIFPNPSTGIFELKTNGKNISEFEITNILGETILKSKINSNKIEIDLSEYVNGIYFVKVVDDKGNSGVKKIIKQ